MNDRVLHILGFETVRSMLAENAVTASGRAAALKLRPETERKKIMKLQSETIEAETILLGNSAHPVAFFDDISSEISRLKVGASLSCGELLRVARLLKSAKKARSLIKPDPDKKISILPEAADGLYCDDAAVSRIECAVINEETVADEASTELKGIRRRIKSENALIREKLNGILRSSEQSKYLQDEIITIRNGRFVVPVKQEYRNQIKGLVHGQSSSGATLFIEPMTVLESNNRLNELEDAEKHEIERILAELTNMLRPYVMELEWDIQILTYFDLIFAKASLAGKMRAFAPAFSENRDMRISGGRHPLINDNEVVPVTLEMLNGTNNLIITGPNTGGKTVTLKLIGLFALMAQSGLFLPAKVGTQLPVFCHIYADIGDEQSIEQSLSTFSSHMKNITEITALAGQDSLVLLDELGAGTDPEEGAALAMAILRALSTRGLTLLATTHYSEIKAFALTTEGFMNASMEFDVDTLSPTYRLITGVSGSSNALLISARLGLPSYIVDSARSFMSQDRLRFDELMLEAERTKKMAENELEKADAIKQEAIDTIEAARSLEEEVSVKKADLLKKAEKDAYEIINRAKIEAEEIIKELKKAQGAPQPIVTKTVEKARKDLNNKKKVLETKIECKAKKPSSSVNPDTIRLGDTVKIMSLGVTGTIDALPDQKGMTGVMAGIMKLNIHYTDLAAAQPPQQIKKMRTSSVVRSVEPVGLSINITGRTVEEAYLELDKYLDDAYLSGRTEVSIIHGKGTGALRAGVHIYLKRHPHVKSFRLGKYGEGEDGVTIVSFK